MQSLSPFFISLISSIVATIFTSIVWLIWNRIKSIDLLMKFLGLNKNDKISIFYGNIYRELSENSDRSFRKDYATFEVGDIDSTLIIYDRFQNSSLNIIDHHIGNENKLISRSNIISISGPKWNKVSEKLIGKVGSPLYFKSGVAGLVEKRRTHPNENIYEIDIRNTSDNSLCMKTYGFIILAKSYFLTDIPLAIVIAGLTTYGSLISAKYLTSLTKSEIRALRKRLGRDKRFGLLIEGEIEIDSDGVIKEIKSINLLSWIPENDFLDPYEYIYS